MKNKLKILILGGQSVIGQYLQEKLKKYFFVQTAGRSAENDYRFDLLEDNLDKKLCENTYDVVIHCASSFGNDSWQGFIENQKTNCLGSLTVAKLLLEVQCQRLLFLSSISSYNHPDNQYYGSYGLSKKHAHEILQLFSDLNEIHMTTLNLSQVYDSKGLAKKNQPFLYTILENAKYNKNINVPENISFKRNYIHINDLVILTRLIIEKNIAGYYDCISPETRSILEIIELAYKTFDRAPQIKLDKSQPDFRSIYIPQDFSLYEKISYFPEVTLENGFMRYRRYFEGSHEH